MSAWKMVELDRNWHTLATQNTAELPISFVFATIWTWRNSVQDDTWKSLYEISLLG